jgi:hypothetical protein
MDVLHGARGEGTRISHAAVLEQPGVAGVDLGGVEALQLHRSQLRHEMLADGRAIAGECRFADARLDRRQPDLCQELAKIEVAGQDIGVLGQGGELAGQGRLAFLTGREAALGLATAFDGLMKLTAAGRTFLLRPPFDPEALPAALAALGAILADIDGVLPRSRRASPSDVALQSVASSRECCLHDVRSSRGCRQGRGDLRKHGK